MKRSRFVLVLALTVAIAAVITAKNSPGRQDMPADYSIKTFLEPDWEMAMHEVFTHYLHAAANFGQRDYKTAKAFLQVMEYYIDMLPDLIPAKTPDGKKINRAKFLAAIKQLRSNTIKLQKLIDQKQYKKATEIAPDYVTRLCKDCHKNAKVPPQWNIGGYKIDE